MDRPEVQLKTNNNDHLSHVMNEVNRYKFNQASADKVNQSEKNKTIPDHLDFSSPFTSGQKAGKLPEVVKDRQTVRGANSGEHHHAPEKRDSDVQPSTADKPQTPGA